MERDTASAAFERSEPTLSGRIISQSAQQSDVAEDLAARFMARTNRVTGAARFALRTESVLHRRIHLPLQLQEIPHAEVFGLEPTQEHVVIPALASQMDMIVAGYPVL